MWIDGRKGGRDLIGRVYKFDDDPFDGFGLKILEYRKGGRVECSNF